MKIKFAKYEHSVIGFPGIVLKFSSDGLHYTDPYVTIKGIINNWNWSFNQEKVCGSIDRELKRFDKWVVDFYSEDISVQG